MQAGVTPLIMAAMTGNTRIADRLLQGGADVNLKADNGITALAAAQSRADTAMIDLLKKSGGK